MTNVSDLKAERARLAEKKEWIYNPDSHEFKCKYGEKEYVIPANDMIEVDSITAEHLKKHLTEYLLDLREPKDIGEVAKMIIDIKKEIEVKI